MKVIEVAAALVFRSGKLLIAQRPQDAHLGGLWEFPRGKREACESFEQCLTRELKEELDMDVEVLELLESVSHRYPEKAVHLRFFRCRWRKNEPRPVGCSGVAWVGKEELRNYKFPAADAKLLRRLERDAQVWREP